MESVTLDAVDRGLLHALQIDGRAPFARIAEVLDVSDRTAARRYARLRAHGVIRVTGVADSGHLGCAEWLVRMRIRPGSADRIATALARRPDTSWVSVLSSGAEVSAVFWVPDHGPAPLGELARHSGIDTLDTQMLWQLSDDRWHGRTATLNAEQAAVLTPPETSGTTTHPRDTGGHRSRAGSALAPAPLDQRLLPVLARDGRMDYPRLAEALSWSESAIRRRLEELRHSRVLRFDVEVDAAVLGFRCQAALWLTVRPARVATVAELLTAHPEVAFVGATTGPRNVIAIVVCRNSRALFDYVTGQVSGLDGVEQLETVPITAIAKRAAPPA